MKRSTIPQTEVPVARPSAQSHESAFGCRSQLMIGRIELSSSETAITMTGENSNAARSRGKVARDFMASLSSRRTTSGCVPGPAVRGRFFVAQCSAIALVAWKQPITISGAGQGLNRGEILRLIGAEPLAIFVTQSFDHDPAVCIELSCVAHARSDSSQHRTTNPQ